MDFQDRYDELDNLIRGLDVIIDDLTDRDYIEQLEIVKFQAQNELEELSENLEKEYKKEEKQREKEYWGGCYIVKNIFQRINEVMKNIEYLTKDDKVEFANTKYKAISEEKVTTAVRNEMVKQGIVILPIKQESENKELIRTEKSVNMLTSVHTKYRIQNIEDKEDYIEVESNGSGVDTQDKGVGKAMTYAYKYMLLRTFAIPTGEDPDKILSVETDNKIAKEIQEEDKLITKTQEEALDKAIENRKIQDETVLKILEKYGYTSTAEIKIKDYMNIVNEFQKLVNS